MIETVSPGVYPIPVETISTVLGTIIFGSPEGGGGSSPPVGAVISPPQGSIYPKVFVGLKVD